MYTYFRWFLKHFLEFAYVLDLMLQVSSNSFKLTIITLVSIIAFYFSCWSWEECHWKLQIWVNDELFYFVPTLCVKTDYLYPLPLRPRVIFLNANTRNISLQHFLLKTTMDSMNVIKLVNEGKRKSNKPQYSIKKISS